MLNSIITKPFILLSLLLGCIIIAFQEHIIYALILLLVMMCGTIFTPKVNTYFKWIYGVSFPLLFFIIAYIHQTQDHIQENLLSKLHKEQLVKVNNTIRYKTHDQIHGRLLNNDHQIKIICKLDTFLPEKLYNGDIISIKGKASEFPKGSQYDDFNPSEYYAKQHIKYIVYTKKENVIIHPISKHNIISLSQKYRDLCLTFLKNLFKDKIHNSLMSGILIGAKQELPQEIVSAFKNTGTSHILAVSGMHLAFIYGLIIFILAKAVRIRNKFANAAITIFLIWLFTFITGSGAAVVRAAVMFSFIEIGKILQRNNDIYNITFGAGFFMLLFNPCIIYDIGFQLSFLAVLSIVLFNPIVKKIYASDYKFINYLWEIISITLSVQVLTLPITMYYFHQFPTYFLIANFIWVPLSTLLMLGGIIALLFYKLLPFVSFLIVYLTEKIIDFGLWIFTIISNLPYYFIENIYIFPELLVAIYIAIFYLAYQIYYSIKINYFYFLILIPISIIGAGLRYLKLNGTNEFICFKIKNEDLIFIRKNNQIFSYGTSSQISNSAAKNYINQNLSKIKNHMVIDTNTTKSLNISTILKAQGTPISESIIYQLANSVIDTIQFLPTILLFGNQIDKRKLQKTDFENYILLSENNHFIIPLNFTNNE